MNTYSFMANPRNGEISIEAAIRYRNNEDFDDRGFGWFGDLPPDIPNPET